MSWDVVVDLNEDGVVVDAVEINHIVGRGMHVSMDVHDHDEMVFAFGKEQLHVKADLNEAE